MGFYPAGRGHCLHGRLQIAIYLASRRRACNRGTRDPAALDGWAAFCALRDYEFIRRDPAASLVRLAADFVSNRHSHLGTCGLGCGIGIPETARTDASPIDVD